MIAEADLARTLALLGHFSEAAASLRRASRVPDQGDPAKAQAALKFFTQLGEVTHRLGEHAEAEAVLTKGLSLRRRRYGENSLAYALGAAPLAEWLLSRARLDEAETLADTALRLLAPHERPEIVPVVVLRGAIRAARYQDERPLLEPLRRLASPSLWNAVTQASLRRASWDFPQITLPLLNELIERQNDAQQEISPRVVHARTLAARACAPREEPPTNEATPQHARLEAALGEVLPVGLLHSFSLSGPRAEDAVLHFSSPPTPPEHETARRVVARVLAENP